MTDFGPVITSDDFNRADNSLRSVPVFSFARYPGEELEWYVDIKDDARVVIQGNQLVVTPEA